MSDSPPKSPSENEKKKMEESDDDEDWGNRKKKKKKISAAEIRKFEALYETQLTHVKNRKNAIQAAIKKREKEEMDNCFFQPYRITREKTLYKKSNPKWRKKNKPKKRQDEEGEGGMKKGNDPKLVDLLPKKPTPLKVSMKKSVEQQVKWEQQRKKNLQALRSRREREEEKLMLASPLSKKTQRIIKRRKKKKVYKNPVAGWKEHFKNYSQKRSQKPVDRTKFNPIISKRTKEITRGREKEGPVHDRLYLESVAIQKKHEQQRFDDGLEMTFRPRISRHAEAVPRTTNVFEDLFYSAKKQQMKQKRKRKANSRSVDMRRVPKINRNSKEIAKKIKYKRKPLYVSPSRRKRKSIDMGKSSQMEYSLGKGRRGSVGNVGHRRSKSVSSRGSYLRSPRDVKKIFDNLYSRNMRFQARKEQMVKELKEKKVKEEESGCTFTPRLSRRSKRIIESRGDKYQFDFGLNKKRVVGVQDSQYEKFLRDNDELLKEHNLDLNLELEDGKDQKKPVVDPRLDVSGGGNKIVSASADGVVKERREEVKVPQLEVNRVESSSETSLRVDSTGYEIEKKKKKADDRIEIPDDAPDMSRYSDLNEINDEVDSAFDDWEKLSKSIEF